jgi:hypothetical protein
MNPAFLADGVLVLHLLLILTIVLTVPLIIIGGWRGWGWVRRPWVRFGHLGLIGFVADESLLGIMCPLTVWENSLRRAAGDVDYGESFIAYWVSRLIYFDLPSWVFTILYCAFALLVALLFRRVPIAKAK